MHRDERAPTAVREAEEVKGSYRRLVIALAVLLVVAVAGSVLYAQAMAGDGVGFAVMKVIADSGQGEYLVVPMHVGESGGDPMPAMSCADGGGCGGHGRRKSKCVWRKGGAASGGSK